MRTTILSVMLLFATLFATAQKDEYYQVMGQTLAGFGNCHSPSDYTALANKFSMIAATQKDEWLPLYYQAEIYVLMSFIDTTGPEIKDKYLDEAEKTMTKLMEMAPNESEVNTMQSMFYSARLVVDPITRGQQFGPLAGQAIGKALAIEPENPRARLMKLQIDIGSAQFFGSDIQPYCGRAKQLLQGWDSYKPQSPIHPNWGKDQLEGLLQQCK